MTKWSVHMLVLKQSATCTCFFQRGICKVVFLFFAPLFQASPKLLIRNEKEKKNVLCFMMHLERNTNIFILHHDIIRIRICSSRYFRFNWLTDHLKNYSTIIDFFLSLHTFLYKFYLNLHEFKKGSNTHFFKIRSWIFFASCFFCIRSICTML